MRDNFASPKFEEQLESGTNGHIRDGWDPVGRLLTVWESSEQDVIKLQVVCNGSVF